MPEEVWRTILLTLRGVKVPEAAPRWFKVDGTVVEFVGIHTNRAENAVFNFRRLLDTLDQLQVEWDQPDPGSIHELFPIMRDFIATAVFNRWGKDAPVPFTLVPPGSIQ